MTTYTWKILDVVADGDVLLQAKYHVAANDEKNVVESEGNWFFSDKNVKKPFNKITEDDIANWIEQESIQDGVSTIKSALDKQLDYLANYKKTSLPWNPQTFKPNL